MLPSTFEAYRINKSWEVTTAKWDNLSKNFDSTDIITKVNYTDSLIWYYFDVTKPIKDHIEKQVNHFGFMLLVNCKISGDANGHASKFISSDDTKNVEKHPKLTVKYNTSTQTNSLMSLSKNNRVFITPISHKKFIIQVAENGLYFIKLYSSDGRLILVRNKHYFSTVDNILSFANNQLTRGVYVLNITHKSQSISTKTLIY